MAPQAEMALIKDMSSEQKTATPDSELLDESAAAPANSMSVDQIRNFENHFRQIFQDFRQSGNYLEGANYAISSLQTAPDIPVVWMEYGRLLKLLGMFDHALFCFRHAATLAPNMMTPLLLFGNCLLAQGNHFNVSTPTYWDDLDLWRTPLDDFFFVEIFNMGLDLHDVGFYEEAIYCHRLFIQYRPHITPALHVISTASLGLGDFPRARVYLQRWYSQSVQKLNLNLWEGQDLHGKTLMVYADHGIGDLIQFVRYLPILAKQTKRLIFRAPPSLWRILGNMPGVDIVGHDSDEYDYICSLYMLPHVIGIDLEHVPNTVPYLHREPDLIAHWADRLPKGGFRIGIAWQGNPSLLDRGRSIPLACYAPIARLPGVKLISLQMNLGLDQLETLPEGMSVTTLGPEFNAGPDNFVDTAAVMQNLDLIISSDTSVPHVAGALACPVWLLLKTLPDWRWLQGRDDSPWYPTMRLFRQQTAGDWEEVIDRVVAELTQLLDAKGFV